MFKKLIVFATPSKINEKAYQSYYTLFEGILVRSTLFQFWRRMSCL